MGLNVCEMSQCSQVQGHFVFVLHACTDFIYYVQAHNLLF